MADEAIPHVRTCTKCSATKATSEFYKNKLGKFGLSSRCKPCAAAYSSIRHKRIREDNPEGIRARQKAWRDNNQDAVKTAKRRDYERRTDEIKARATEWATANPERRRLNQQAWRDANRERVRESQRRAERKSLETAKGRLHRTVKANVRNGLVASSKQGRRTFDLLGYTVEELKAHLERQFAPGMSWSNYGRGGWHIDHIVPLAAHNFERPEDPDFHRAWALSNLRPLWELENLRKGSRLEHPFQPSLLIGGVVEIHGQNRGAQGA